MLHDQRQEGLISELTEWIVFVEGASAIHAKVLETAPLLLCFGKFPSAPRTSPSSVAAARLRLTMLH